MQQQIECTLIIFFGSSNGFVYFQLYDFEFLTQLAKLKILFFFKQKNS